MVEGSLEWEDSYLGARAHYMMRRARATDDYDEVLELYGVATVSEWLKDLSNGRIATSGRGHTT